MSDTKITVADIICMKTWVSCGAIAEPIEAERRPYYPKVGMRFTGELTQTAVPPFVVTKYNRNEKGSYDAVEMTARGRFSKTVKFKVDQTLQSKERPDGIPRIDPATRAEVQLFPARFKANFEKTTFYEHGENVLVSAPVHLDPDEIPDVPPLNKLKEMHPVSITFTVEVYRNEEDGHVYMLQRAYWSSGKDNIGGLQYIGSYCCS